jgi:predicted  nucleic acid-binding Zn-ribbon protein
MAKKKELTVEDKLRALYDLQLIDSRIDEIKRLRGELPLEVEDLEDEIEGLKTRLEKVQTEITDYDAAISDKKNIISEADALTKRYTEQQKNVRNNREFNALSKEIEFQELEKELAEKLIKELFVKINFKKELIDGIKTDDKTIVGLTEKIVTREDHLKHKKGELDTILAETEKEEEALLKKSADYGKIIEAHLIKAYTRIRTSVKNGLAVVPIARNASSGSFFTIPPQRQLEIATRTKIITDEHSGRILVDAELAAEEAIKMEKLFAKLK